MADGPWLPYADLCHVGELPRMTAAQQRLALSCINLAFSLANRNRLLCLMYGLDMVQSVALELLCKAAIQYDPERPAASTGKPVKFSTYAAHCIAQGMRTKWSRGGEKLTQPWNRAAPIGEEFDDELYSVYRLGRLDPPVGEVEDRRAVLARVVGSAALTPQESRALGLTVARGQTLVAAGDAMGLSKERVRQLRNKGLAKLRESARALGIKDY